MLGKLSSVGVVVEMLKREGVRNWAVKEFVQGQRTRRWGVAWSWGGLRPEGRVARGLNVGKVKAVKRGREAVERAAGRKRAHVEDVEDESEREEEHESGQGVEAGLLPFPPEFGFELPPAAGVEADPDDMGRKIDAAIRNLEDIKWQWKPAQHVGLGIAQDGDCWSRRARRRKEKEKRQMNEDEGMKEDGDEDEDEDKEKEPAFAFKIKVGRSSMDGEKEMGGVVMTVRWLQGQDHVLFESFCGWVKRKSGS